MQNYFCIGSSPSEEDCAQVGAPGYREQAVAECTRYIELLRRAIGPEPEGARLAIKWFDHDFGAYCEVVCYFNSENRAAVEYAQRCEDDAPATWEGHRV
jgi:hypothetical protein